MGKGRTYEMRIVNDIAEATTDSVWVGRPDYSGNSNNAIADVAVIWNGEHTTRGAFNELKKRTGEAGKRTVVIEGSKQGESGVDEVRNLIDGTPTWGEPRVGIRFDHRKLLFIHAEDLLLSLGEDNPPFYARETRGGNISLVKPSTDEWRSAAAADVNDAELIMEHLGVPHDA